MKGRIKSNEAERMRRETQQYLEAVYAEHPDLYAQEKIDPYPIREGTILPLRGLRAIAYGITSKLGISLKELRGRSRSKKYVHARWQFYVKARADGFSLAEIGRFVSKDHTTVLHGLRSMGVVQPRIPRGEGKDG